MSDTKKMVDSFGRTQEENKDRLDVVDVIGSPRSTRKFVALRALRAAKADVAFIDEFGSQLCLMML